MLSETQITHALEAITKTLGSAEEYFYRWQIIPSHDEERFDRENTAYFIEKAFAQLLLLFESQGMMHAYATLRADYDDAKRVGFEDSNMGPDEPYLAWVPVLRRHMDAIGAILPPQRVGSVTKDLVSILEASVFPITDPTLFPQPPQSEDDVHLRIEGILRVIFPDLLRKPRIPKPVKSFEPDTGIPSLRTLIEYKFISESKDAARIADEILADSGGYKSPEWDKVVYVIYETSRIKPATEWDALLRASGVSNNTIIIVLHGVPITPTSKKNPVRRTILKKDSSKADNQDSTPHLVLADEDQAQ